MKSGGRKGQTDRLTEGNKKKTRGTNERENREGTQPKILSSKLSLDIFHGCHVIALRDALCKRKRLRSLARYLLSCTHPNIRFLPDMSHRWGDENYHLLRQTGKWLNRRKATLQSANGCLRFKGKSHDSKFASGRRSKRTTPGEVLKKTTKVLDLIQKNQKDGWMSNMCKL